MRSWRLSGARAQVRLGYDVLLNSDEETGSLASSELIAELARGKLAALTYEPAALPDGTLAHARGGSGNYSVIITGKSAHAGRNPDDGRNAIVAAADLAVRLKALHCPDISVNPAKIEGGSANNVVPDHAVLRFNIRPAIDRGEPSNSSMISKACWRRLRAHTKSPPTPMAASPARQSRWMKKRRSFSISCAIAGRNWDRISNGSRQAACAMATISPLAGSRWWTPWAFAGAQFTPRKNL